MRLESRLTLLSGLCGLTSWVGLPSLTKTAWESPNHAVRSKFPLMRQTTAVVPPLSLCFGGRKLLSKIVEKNLSKSQSNYEFTSCSCSSIKHLSVSKKASFKARRGSARKLGLLTNLKCSWEAA